MSSTSKRLALGPALSLLVFLAGCEAAGTLAGGGPQSDYLVARQALETGNYDLAITRYGSLMASLDPVSAQRIQLEYAHALLRANRYDEAIGAAEPLVGASDGSIRVSALAVRGTARHEAARQLIGQGGERAAIRAQLTGAQSDLAEVTRDAGFDETGSMRARAQLIASDLRGAG